MNQTPIRRVVQPVTALGNDASDHWDDPDYLERAVPLGEAPFIPTNEGGVKRFHLLTDDEIANLPPLEWLVKGVLPASGLAAMYGAPGSGKSFLALELAAAVASGSDFFGYKVKNRPVAYFALEGAHGFRQRVLAWRETNGRGTGVKFITQRFDLRDPSDVDALAGAVTRADSAGGLLVLDTLSRAAPGFDENSPVDMGNAINALASLQGKIGGLVLVVHHSGKDAAKGLRGHTSLLGALDVAVEVTRSDDSRRWKVTKTKDSSDGAQHSFYLESVELDGDSDPVTSCAVVPGEAPIRPQKKPLNGQKKTAWDVLGEMLKAACGSTPPGVPPSLPAGRPCVPFDAAVKTIGPRLGVESKRHGERAKSALRGLQNDGYIRIDSDFLWVT